MTEVIVIGGGYAGVLAANRLTADPAVHVTLINPRSRFVERIRLHQRVAGTHDATVDYSRVLAPRVDRIAGTVELIDAAARTVTLESGATARYDYLIYAVGSTGAPVPDGAHSLATFEQAEQIELTGGPVTVVGAGPTGIETAAELAERGHPVTLATGGTLGPYLHPRTRRHVAARLAALHVEVSDQRVTRPSGLTVWTTGFAVPDLAARSGLSTDAAGRLLTDETLTSVDDDRIVAAGDCAAPSGRPLRMSCQAAGPLGMHAADTVLARIAGRQPGLFVAGFLGQCLSLGRRYGVFQFAARNDVAGPRYLGGRAAAVLKEAVCRSTVAQLGMEARRPGRFHLPAWAGDRERRRILENA
ncbi:FAD-dependent oxidoreductase [Actinoplanes sp. NPDC051861]|uniref:NAD(P)/FAD-dependent oxidoreductase n=1 Tax=Actinoplanes sp. NPDC051861 TaxID=3155170 RepID=UPI0034332CED